MPWPSWDQAAIACGVAIAIALLARRIGIIQAKAPALAPALSEFALVSGLYSIWRIARQLPFTQEAGAIARGRAIGHFQDWLHLPNELSMQHFAIRHEWLARFVNAYYATLHIPALVVFLCWMWWRHRDAYPHWRNGLVYVTLGCLLIRFIRVAPPRFIPELDFVNLSDRLGFRVYGDPGTGISDQYAAMPSIHVAWAAVVGIGAVAVSTSRLRWIVGLHLPLTMYVVAVTGHHWWLDGIVALLLLGAGLAFDTRWRRWHQRRRTRLKRGSQQTALPSATP